MNVFPTVAVFVLAVTFWMKGYAQAEGNNSDVFPLLASLKNQVAALQASMDAYFNVSRDCSSGAGTQIVPDGPHDCLELMKKGQKQGPYEVYLAADKGRKLTVDCDMNTAGGGWLVIQRRVNGSENFTRSYAEYENGFGNRNGEFWLGNKNIHALSAAGNQELLVLLKDFRSEMKYAHYDIFSVDEASKNYTLHVSNYLGTAGDSLIFDHDGHGFSTYDHDVDGNDKINCAERDLGGWWYSNCYKSNLNGKWGVAGETGILYGSFHNWTSYVLKETVMMIRPHKLT